MTDSEMGLEAQQRQHSVFSLELESRTASCSVMMSTISLMVIAFFVVWLNFHDRDMVAVNVYRIKPVWLS